MGTSFFRYGVDQLRRTGIWCAHSGYQFRENPGAFEPDGSLTAVHHVDNPDTKEGGKRTFQHPAQDQVNLLSDQCFLNCPMIWFNENQAILSCSLIYLIE